LDVLENFSHSRLSQDFPDECDGGCEIRLDYVPWNLIEASSIYRLQLVACFFEICGVLVDVFWAIVYLRPLRRHYREMTRSERVNRDNGLI
jgi:hypothetical protein